MHEHISFICFPIRVLHVSYINITQYHSMISTIVYFIVLICVHRPPKSLPNTATICAKHPQTPPPTYPQRPLKKTLPKQRQIID